MYELLIRIETLCMDAETMVLLIVGLVTLIVGLLLWLAGNYFSAAIIGILGAVLGAFCGLLISQWLEVDSLLSMSIGAVVLCIAAVLFKNIVLVILAVITFALASGTTYSSFILRSTEQLQSESTESPSFLSSFSNMDSSERLNYMQQVTQQSEGFFEKLKAMLKDTMNSMSPHKWKLLLSVVLGGLGGLLLIWLIKKLMIAVCCSGIGVLLVLLGVESLLMTVGVQMCNAFREHRLAPTVTYFVMVGIGTVVQVMTAKPRKSVEVQVEHKKNKAEQDAN